MGILTEPLEAIQPKYRQRDLFQDYGQHTRATRREALQGGRKPLLERVIATLRSLGRYGATRWELHELLGVPYQSICRPCLDLVNDHTLTHTGERRKTPTGSWAAVMVHSDFAGSEVK